jgi:PAS domain-containing protein
VIEFSVSQVILSLLTVLAGGGLIGRWLAYRLGDRKLNTDERKQATEERTAGREQERIDFKTILEAVTTQRDEGLRREERQNSRIDALELEVQGLRLIQEVDPFPNWIIDLEGQYIYVNREFEREFLEPKKHTYRWIIGKRHEDMWPVEFGEKLQALDRQARSRPDKRARATLSLNGRQITVHKFPVCVKGVPVAYAGFITDME